MAEEERRRLLTDSVYNVSNVGDSRLVTEQIYDDGDGETVIRGYTRSVFKSIIAYFMCLMTGGLLLLIFHWKPEWHLLVTHTRTTLEAAKKILILETFQKKWKTYHIKPLKEVVINDGSNPRFSYQNENFQNSDDDRYQRTDPSTVKINFDDGTAKDVASYRMFRSKKMVFVWDEDRHKFQMMIGLEKSTTCMDFHNVKGFSKEYQAKIRHVYGFNNIDVPVHGILQLIFLEFFNPFYMFQVFSVAVWLAENYYYYCIAIVVMSAFGITTSVIQTRRNQKNLRSTVQSSGTVQVCRNLATGEIEEVESHLVVPGDLIIIPPQGCTMHVDAVLLEGSCIVNESMLTGESVPVTKTAIPHQSRLYEIKGDSNHTLYCGTRVIQTRYYNNEAVKAVVLRTGFLTTKGQLVRSIMYPLPADFKFDRDSYKFIIILTIIAALGLVYTVTLKAGRSISAADVAIKSLDILTIVIPPALPAAMTLGRLYAISRLRNKKVYCINPRVINVCGSINCVCFDKTGTLTEDGLDMWGIIPVKPFKNNDKDKLDVILAEPVKEAKLMDDNDIMKIAMSVCHSLTYIEGELTGDPLEVKMFESTGWHLEEASVPDNTKFDLLVPTMVRPRQIGTDVPEWGIVHQYQFSSSLQRSSVICRKLGSLHYTVVSKGSPEMIAALSLPETVPSDLKTSLRYYTRQGYRVLALAYKELNEEGIMGVHKLHREEAESKLIFLGLMVLENRLKPETKPIIEELTSADIKLVMITGDNLDTAVSVATECGILRHGDRLVKCEGIYDEKDDNGLPSLYYTQTLISVSGLHHSNVNQTDLTYINTLNGASSKWPPSGLTSSTSLTHPGLHGESTSTLESVESNEQSKGKIRVIMDGTTWGIMREHFPELLMKIITCGAVFARMSSDQKQALVQDLQSIGYYVAMCGDGANDCGALKAAHAGISVSGQESSVASPFTSQEGHVGCVPLIIREGRAALTTSFGMFKFMVAYSITEFFTVAFLYYFDSNLTDFQFLYIDIVLSINFAFFFGRTEAYSGKICKIPPGMSLLGFVPLFSLILQLLLNVAFQLGIYFILRTYPWYVVHEYQSDIDYLSHENYALFCLSMFQYITLAIAFSRGAPYRKIIFTNYSFLLALLITTILGVYIAIYPASWLIDLLQLKMPPEYGFRLVIIGLAFANFVISLIAEKFIVDYLMQSKKMVPRLLREDVGHRNSHKKVEHELENDPNWPPVSPRRESHNIFNVIKENSLNNLKQRSNSVENLKKGNIETS